MSFFGYGEFRKFAKKIGKNARTEKKFSEGVFGANAFLACT